MSQSGLLPRPKKNIPCIVIIGMAGSGKTTIGMALAEQLGWAFLDTDKLIEAAYATRLQDISNTLTKKQFLDMEATMIMSLRTRRTVIATGGSVVYRHKAMLHLRELGTIVALDAPFSVIQERIASNPERGLVIEEGQTLQDLYIERKALYDKYADIHCSTTRLPEQCSQIIISKIPFEYRKA